MRRVELVRCFGVSLAILIFIFLSFVLSNDLGYLLSFAFYSKSDRYIIKLHGIPIIAELISAM